MQALADLPLKPRLNALTVSRLSAGCFLLARLLLGYLHQPALRCLPPGPYNSACWWPTLAACVPFPIFAAPFYSSSQFTLLIAFVLHVVFRTIFFVKL